MSANQYNHITDAELLKKHLESDHNQWIGILLERYTLLLLGVCMKYLKDEHEANDAVQQIFLKVIQDVHKYKIDFFKSWLYMVAKNHCFTILRSKKITDDIEEIYSFSVEDNTVDEDLKKIEEIRLEVLQECLDELTTEQKQCILLFYIEKKSYSEIVVLTSFTPLQVKSHIQNGKRNLKINILKKTKAHKKNV